MPDSIYLDSLLYKFVLREMDRRHLVLYFFPATDDGSQLILSLSRPHERSQPYRAADLRMIDQVCEHFADELGAVPPGPHAPRHAVPEEHHVDLDSDFRFQAMPLYMEALLALFYGASATPTGAPSRLPPALESEIRSYCDRSPDSGQARNRASTHAFTKAHRGRVLCLAVHVRPGGGCRLSVHEDVSRHERLRRIIALCRALERDRTAVFSACLVVAEGVQDAGEIARRAGFAALKPASAQRLVNQARRIVAEI